MRRRLRIVLLGAVAALALVVTVPTLSEAAYPRRVERQYYRNYYRPDYGYHYGYRYPGPRYYHYNPGVHVYRYPHRYHDYYRYHPHGGVDVGPFRFELWH